MFPSVIFIGVLLSALAAQAQQVTPQSDTWNSTYKITQARGTNLTAAALHDISVALNFERTNWAAGSVTQDPFYTVPANSSNARPGSVIKVQRFTNTTTYTLPPNTALSRILFMTEDLNGTAIPASAYILWPYLPLTQPDGTFPLVSWGHGTYGVFADCAVSHLRSLLYQYGAPYTLALAGYVVVAPDYAGIGINKTAIGEPIYHPYQAGQAQGADLLYAAQAAQAAFPNISQYFITMGHSQGGSAAWGAAVRAAQSPFLGYLGSIAGSPNTNLSALVALAATNPDVPPTVFFYWVHALRGLHPNFNLSTFLTNQGIARYNLAHDLSMCSAALLELFPAGTAAALVRPDWLTVPEIVSFLELIDLGNQPVAGPMLVLQGTADTIVPEILTTAAVAQTCSLYPDSGIQYWRFENVTHVPVLYASQRLWLDWIAVRFAAAGDNGNLTAPGSGGKAGGPCTMKNYTSVPFPTQNYQAELGYYLELATQAYQVA